MGTFTSPFFWSYRITCSSMAIRWEYIRAPQATSQMETQGSLCKSRAISVQNTGSDVVWDMNCCIGAKPDVMWQCQEASVASAILRTTASARAATFWLECCLNDKPHIQAGVTDRVKSAVMVKGTFSTLSSKGGGGGTVQLRGKCFWKKGITINYLTHALPVLTCCSKSGAFNDGVEVCHS